MDCGVIWEKCFEVVFGVMGFYYYQELYVSLYQFDCLYLMDVCIQVLEDGGKSFCWFKEEYKYFDNYVIVFWVDDLDYLLVGIDGGLYESFDLVENWCYMVNLLLMQFYKIVFDDMELFYNIYGGIQDNSIQGGLF